MSYRERSEMVQRVLVDLVDTLPSSRSNRRPLHGIRKYRGKERWVVGYSWTKLYSHHMNGRVYETVLGYGDTFESALKMAKER